MEEKERYYYKKILRDCVMPEGLFEIKDRESNFYLIIENKKDVDTITNLLNQQDQKIKDLEYKLADSEEQIKGAREAANMAVDSWCKNRRKYEAQIAEMQNKSFILYSMLYETLEKQGCDNVASQIDQMTGWTYDKEVNWLKGNRNYDQFKQSQNQKAIEELNNLKRYCHEWYSWSDVAKRLDEVVDDRIKELKGEEKWY